MKKGFSRFSQASTYVNHLPVVAMEGQPNPSLRSKEAVWQELVQSNPEKALAVWCNCEVKRSWKKPRYSSEFNWECVQNNPDWKVFLYHNVPDTSLSDSDDDDELGLRGGAANDDGLGVRGAAADDDIGAHAIAVVPSSDSGGVKDVVQELRGPGSPRDGNFCECRARAPYHSIADVIRSFRDWSFSVTAIVTRTGSQPVIDVNDL